MMPSYCAESSIKSQPTVIMFLSQVTLAYATFV